MKHIAYSLMLKKINDGILECVTDLKIGYVEVRWCKTGKHEIVNVFN